MSKRILPLKFAWLHVTLLALVLLGLLGGVRLAGLAETSASLQPVWGRKPVLYYFMLTPELSGILRKDVELTPEQFDVLRAIAQEEMAAIRALNAGSLPVIQDASLTVAEKRERIVEMDYNARVQARVADTRSQVQAALDADTYQRLVDWIERRWAVETFLRTSPQAADAGRTYNIYATFYDTDNYTVALPDQCVKFSNIGWITCEDVGYVAGDNYSVKINHSGNSVTVKVLEAGPWNLDDTFWATTSDPTPRRMFTDLPLGMPEAQAAYFDNYNGGLDQYGRTVTAPFAIDLSFKVAPDLGLQPGENTWLDVTFLWTDGWDSTPNPVDEIVLKKPSKLTPSFSNDTCSDYWYRINGYSGEDAYLTLNVDNEAYSTNSGEWVPNLPEAGTYRVEAYVPDHASITWPCPSIYIQSDTSEAHYVVKHADGTKTVVRDQGPLQDEWISLGDYDFKAGTAGKVTLSDLNGEPGLTHTVSFSAMRFILLASNNPDPTPTRTASPTPTVTLTPTPTSTPTPTPTPQPYIGGGVGLVEPNQTLTLPMRSSNIYPPGFGEVVVDVNYDPAIVDAVACNPDPDALFSPFDCDLDYDHDGVNPDTVRISLNSTGGVTGSFRLAEIGFEALAGSGSYSLLEVRLDTLAAPDGSPLSLPVYNGAVCVAPCKQVHFMPLFLQHFTTGP